LYAEWETDLDEGTEQGDGGLPDWEFTQLDETEDESA
jgi:hypothetical protein